MNEYEVIYESLQDQLDQGMVSEEFANEVNELAYEKYVMEAGRKEYALALKEAQKSSKEYNKKIKSLMKEKKYMQVIAIYKKEQKDIKKAISIIKNFDDSVLDVVLTDVISIIKNWAKDLLSVIVLSGVRATYQITTGNDPALVDNHRSMVGIIKEDTFFIILQRSIKNLTQLYLIAQNLISKYRDKKPVKSSDFNAVRNKVIKELNSMDSAIDKKIKEIQNIIKLTK